MWQWKTRQDICQNFNPKTFEIFLLFYCLKNILFTKLWNHTSRLFHYQKFYPWTKIFDTRAAWKHHNDNNDDDYDDNDDDDDDNDED